MQCNDIDGINASGRAPIIMQQALARWLPDGARPRLPPRLKCQLETMSMALGKASLRLGTQPAARAVGLQSSIARRGCCRRYDINIIMSNGNFLLRSPLPSILHATWMRSE